MFWPQVLYGAFDASERAQNELSIHAGVHEQSVRGKHVHLVPHAASASSFAKTSDSFRTSSILYMEGVNGFKYKVINQKVCLSI